MPPPCPLRVGAAEPGLARRGCAWEMLCEETQHLLGLCFRAGSRLGAFPGNAGIQAQLLCNPLLTGSKGTTSHGNGCFVQAAQIWPCLVISWLVYSIFLSLLNISCILSPWLWHQARTGEQIGLSSGFPAGHGVQDRSPLFLGRRLQLKPRAFTPDLSLSLFNIPTLWAVSCVCRVEEQAWDVCVCVIPGTRDHSLINNCGEIRPNEMCPSGLDLRGLHVSSLR